MITHLHNIVLYCKDPTASRAWYERVGFTGLRGFLGMHWVGLGDLEIMLHPSEQGPAGACPQLYAAVDDIDAFLKHLLDQGLQPVHHQAPGPLMAPVTTPWGSREVELFAPDGHRWGFLQD